MCKGVIQTEFTEIFFNHNSKNKINHTLWYLPNFFVIKKINGSHFMLYDDCNCVLSRYEFIQNKIKNEFDSNLLEEINSNLLSNEHCHQLINMYNKRIPLSNDLKEDIIKFLNNERYNDAFESDREYL